MVHFASPKPKSLHLNRSTLSLEVCIWMASSKPNKTGTKSNNVNQTWGGLGRLEGSDTTLENGQTLMFKTPKKIKLTQYCGVGFSAISSPRPRAPGVPGRPRLNVVQVPQQSSGGGSCSAAPGVSHKSLHGGASTDCCLRSGHPHSHRVVAGCLSDFFCFYNTGAF